MWLPFEIRKYNYTGEQFRVTPDLVIDFCLKHVLDKTIQDGFFNPLGDTNMATVQSALQAKLDEVTADIAANPFVDPRLAVQADLQAQLAKGESWLQMEVDALKTAVATDWAEVKAVVDKYLN